MVLDKEVLIYLSAMLFNLGLEMIIRKPVLKGPVITRHFANELYTTKIKYD